MNKTSLSTLQISFIPLSKEHFSLIHTWFNKPHVQDFYSLRTWTIEEVSQKLTPYIQGVGDMKCYIIFVNTKPVGYLQCYPVKKHPWDNQNIPDDVVNDSAGLDLFIGEKERTGKGLGCHILNEFLKKYIWPHYRYCLADPDIRNEASIRLFKKCGFREYQLIKSIDALRHPVSLQLFIKEREQGIGN